jgi:predicted TIM-barrel fold metal-dependent hydrolase
MSANSPRGGLFRACRCCSQPAVPMRPARRNFLAGGLAALGLGAAAPIARPLPAAAQAPAAKTRIDVHHHFLPQLHRDVLTAPGRRAVGPPPKWSPELSLEDMDRSGIATAILSAVRKLNEYAARMGQDHPGRFGLFAVIAPPDVPGSLKEIEYALDTLKADGIGLFTSYQDKYLGDPAFAPIYEELNRRKAVIYVHPTAPACCRGLVPGIPPGSIEYATDSTRTIAHIVFGGTAAKFPDIRWIFSHSGGTLPFLTGRFIRLAEERKPAHLPDGPLPAFQKFYYELAQGNTPGQIAALLKMVSISQVMYGTDYPFRDGAEVNKGIADWGFAAADLRALERDNALKLLPRIKAG